MERRLSVGVASALFLTLGGCALADTGKKVFEDKPGDIVASEPSTVVSKWSIPQKTGKHGPYGWAFYLNTEECFPGNSPKPGPEVGQWCSKQTTNVNIDDYQNFKDGDTLRWKGASTDSLVESHSFGWDYRRVTNYRLALLVRQCGAFTENNQSGACIEDYVEVNPTTWFDSSENQTISFSGNPGTVVS